jgi:hypothetical protein
VKSYGLDVLIQKTLRECKEALNGDLHYVMTKNISDEMNDNLVKENAKIKNYIKEKNILDFTKNYNCNDESEFQDYIINIYGKNINCFLNRELSNNGKNIIASSNLMKHNNNFIKYYQERKNIIISKELESLSIKGLIFQASTEKKKGISTLIQNKRDLEDFNKHNSIFLTDNFSNLAQKYYVFFILQKSCLNVSELFERQLNNIVQKILENPNIKNKITSLFKTRFKEFEEKILNKSSLYKLPGNFTESNTFQGKNVNNNDNGEIVTDFSKRLNNDLSSENTNINSLKTNSNKNNHNKPAKQFSEINSTITIPYNISTNQQKQNHNKNAFNTIDPNKSNTNNLKKNHGNIQNNNLNKTNTMTSSSRSTSTYNNSNQNINPNNMIMNVNPAINNLYMMNNYMNNNMLKDNRLAYPNQASYMNANVNHYVNGSY